MIRMFKAGVTAVGAVAAFSLVGAPLANAAAMDQSTDTSGIHIYEANLTQLNNSGAHGVAIIIAQGNQAEVAIKSVGLSANLPHAQHLHFGAMGTCPDLSADTNHDGLISVTEAAPDYGAIYSSLTTTGDTSAASALAVDRFPDATADGTISYDRTITLPAGITAENLGTSGVIVQHGISKLFGDPTMYDGSMVSDIDPSLPFEATVPADCGALKDITPMVMADAQYPVAFDSSINGALTALHSSLGSNDGVTAPFDSAYQAATEQFGQTLMDATTAYSSMMMSNPDVARDMYVNAFNNAKATYFGQLEAARNALVDSLSGVNDPAKDTFVISFNSARDAYGNQLESAKNQF